MVKSGSARTLASSLRRGAGAPVSLVPGDIATLPVRARAFDGAMASHVLHLVPDWRPVLGEIAPVLWPGGLVPAWTSARR